MQREWNIELIFPIKDAASAALMVIKADYLHKAGIISVAEKQWVYSRARTFGGRRHAQRRSLICALRENLRNTARMTVLLIQG